MIHFPRLFVRFGQFKVPVALLCSVRCVVLLLMTCPRVTCPCFVIALLQHVFRCTDFPPDCCHASLCFKQCSLYSLYSTMPQSALSPLCNSLTKYNKLRLPGLGKNNVYTCIKRKIDKCNRFKSSAQFLLLLLSLLLLAIVVVFIVVTVLCCCCHLLKRCLSAL